MVLSHYIDHTLLKATATEADMVQLCREAIEYDFYAVCVNGCHVALCRELLKGSTVKLACVAGFPLGAMDSRAKLHEAVAAVEQGAQEIDMVLNIGWLKSGKAEEAGKEIRAIKEAIGSNLLKVIIETCYLTDDEKKTAILLTADNGADFVKTSTGFGTGGATLEDVTLMKSLVGDFIQIKASGGIRDRATALQFIEAGATRIGTSNGIAIVKGSTATEHY